MGESVLENKKKIVVIYQEPFLQVLQASVSENAEVVLWLPIEAENHLNVQDLTRICRYYTDVEICLMVQTHAYKNKIKQFVKTLGIPEEQILDVYKACMARFSRKRYQRILEPRRNEVFDGLVLGGTSGVVGICEENLPGKVCNLCGVSQDIYFSYRVLESICESFTSCFERLKYVVIEASDYACFNYDTILSDDCETYLEDSGFDCENRSNWNKEYSPEELVENIEDKWKQGTSEFEQQKLNLLFPYIQEKGNDLRKGTWVLHGRRHALTENDIATYKSNYIENVLHQNVFENTTAFQISNLEKILKLLKKINPKMKVFLTLLPKHYEMEQLEKSGMLRWKKFFGEITEELKETYSGLRVLDFKDCDGFSKNKRYYENMSEFNQEGAQAFSNYIATILSDGYDVLNKNEAKPKPMIKDWRMQAMGELLTAYNSGRITEETISQLKYSHLVALLEILKSQRAGKELYVKVKTHIESIAVNKMKKQEKIVVGFMANYSATWVGNRLYQLFENSERYEPYVFLLATHYGEEDHYENVTKKEYKEEIEKFKKYPVRLIQTMDPETGREYTWEEIGIKPQLLIWLSPWAHAFRDPFHLYNYPLDVLHTYIPYSFMLAENEQGNYVEHQYNYIMHNLTWRNFDGSFKDIEMAEKNAFVGASNVVYVGYPKMDDVYDLEIAGENIWEELEEKTPANKGKKRIIFAPHHSVDDKAPVHFSTFASNYQLMLQLAEQYQEETVWVMRPHPQLKMRALSAGLFQSEEEWEEYLAKWNSLPNATVMLGGTYMKLFRDSDAMIDDSVSYLAEYLYTNKPLLFLTGDRQAFNDFGKELVSIHYSVAGEDLAGIQEFINTVVLQGKDEKASLRNAYFNKNLNYLESKGCLAAEGVFEAIASELA